MLGDSGWFRGARCESCGKGEFGARRFGGGAHAPGPEQPSDLPKCALPGVPTFEVVG